ncbi:MULTISPECIES: DUF2142 domain-containing protein [unclassified Arthrobacter]|uniref:DUF2142 domain-containing protein n=1 Tax=unclassified Arthrobacter TaxID=235627 RepID=UPI003397D290
MSGLERTSDNTSTMSRTPGLHRDGTLAGSEAKSSQRKGRSLFLKLFALFSLVISLWALATPLMAFPDEPAHTIKAAAVVRNQITVQEGMSFGHGIHVKVPAYIANLDAQRCYKYRPDTSAGCAPVIPADDNYETIGVTTAGTYNPMYYWIVGLPSLWLTGAPALYAMRIVSSILTAAFLAAGFTALSRFLRPQIPILLASVSMTPMVLFLGSGINPNSLEVAATMAAFCGFIVLLDNAHRPEAVIPAVVTVVAASTILANTRQVSLIWLLCALMVGLSFYQRRSIFAAFRNKLVLTAVAATVPGVILGIVWILLMLNAPASAGVAPIGIINPMPGVRADQGFVTMLDRFFGFFPQYVGVMGWLDSRLPDAVQMFWSFLFVVALLLPVAVRPLRRTAGYWLALVLLLVIPAALQAQVVTSMGFIWQGRYNLPLFLVLLISAGIACRHLRISQSEGAQTIGRIVVVAAIAVHGLAFAYILRRYVVGIRELANWQIMITKPEWQPPLGWLVLIAAYVVLMALAGHFLFKFVFPGALLFTRPFPVLSGEPKTTTESVNLRSTIAEAHSRSRT